VPAGHLTDDQVAAAVEALTGEIQQVPSSVSAIKVKGERAYHRVRAGEDVELPPRPVTVSRFDILATRVGEADGTPVLDVDVDVTVSSGTYVRALARDLGAELAVGGHLTALRRTRVGAFTLDAAHDLDSLAAVADPSLVPVVPLAEAAREQFAVRELDEAEATAVGYGQRVPSAQPGRLEPVAAFAPNGRLVAMLDESGQTARAHVVFAPAGS
jgi:tRNA pseudouridine55 synthase